MLKTIAKGKDFNALENTPFKVVEDVRFYRPAVSGSYPSLNVN